MKLLTQPGDGVKPLLEAIDGAKESIDIAVFRFDRKEIEKALVRAVQRGVQVRALIAYTNRGGEKSLRNLETRLLGAGVTVSRTADDLVRYHAKYLIVDRAELLVLAFNFTYLDIEQSRSFAIFTKNKEAVEEAIKVFEMDMKRQPYSARLDWLIVSPANAREKLEEFIKGAKKELLIYDPCISDSAMLQALEERARNGVDVKVIGRVTHHSSGLKVVKLHDMRLHTRLILRDSKEVFVGSQSLRSVELDKRREVGLIFEDQPIVDSISKTFLNDWDIAAKAKEEKDKVEVTPTKKMAKKVAKAVVKELPDVTPMIESALKELGDAGDLALNSEELQENVKDAVKRAVKTAVKDAMAEPPTP